MAFLTEEKKPMLSDDQRKEAENIEIAAIVKARGFEPGSYRFEPNANVQRKDGSITNGTVKGYFVFNDLNDIVLDREKLGLNEKTWKRLCAEINRVYKYTSVTDIDRLVITPKSVKIEISLATPATDD